MNLTDAQKQQISTWLDEGLKVADVQKKMIAELGVTMTYMEVRFLLDDLRLKPKDPEPPKAPAAASPIAPASAGTSAPAGAAAGLVPDAAAPVPGGRTSVTVDKLARPGTVVSGKVTFSDGQKADWYLDEMGRPGLVPAQKGYRPTQTDIMEFQDLLQVELQKLGF
ncbi:MAG: hypothetical protein EBY09_10825 [Verrucomicrobia bacterium]|nr:hypothetical protein [Verrucomicrobiota bacterium]NBU11169.1 hypothetical protein [Pseudomonadota bacterium]NDA67115.1 hypothetical protein [Verrucomicrobiota bacterium]NDD38953.1 hypothetical protein [Verrucomicrobiota bacterium]